MYPVTTRRPNDSIRPADPRSAWRSALETVVRQQQAGVWRYLRTLGCTPDLADDLTQETFLVAHHRGLAEIEAEALGTFLRSTARFLYLRNVRNTRRRAELLADAADRLWARDCAPDDGAGWLEALRACVSALEGRSRRAVHLFYAENLDRNEVATRLGMRANGVKTLLHRVRNALRDCVRRRLS
jgi:RNA polymerase sigma-70 factor (ECF subfamily)